MSGRGYWEQLFTGFEIFLEICKEKRYWKPVLDHLRSGVNLDIWYLNNYCQGGWRTKKGPELSLVKQQ